jgi:hypothetical protein
MKALTLTQPWATLVAVGAVTHETRSWQTKYRGPLAIHAAKGFPKWAREICSTQPFRRLLAQHGYRDPTGLPVGVVLGTVELVDCLAVTKANLPPEPDRSVGEYGPGRFMWVLQNVKTLPEPILAKGMLGLWEWQPPRGRR